MEVNEEFIGLRRIGGLLLASMIIFLIFNKEVSL